MEIADPPTLEEKNNFVLEQLRWQLLDFKKAEVLKVENMTYYKELGYEFYIRS